MPAPKKPNQYRFVVEARIEQILPPDEVTVDGEIIKLESTGKTVVVDHDCMATEFSQNKEENDVEHNLVDLCDQVGNWSKKSIKSLHLCNSSDPDDVPKGNIAAIIDQFSEKNKNMVPDAEL